MLTFASSNPDFFIYMGDDKFENEQLIAWGWPEDVWFHVDDFSSAHVYVRLPKGFTIKNIPESVLEECCQLTKGNSIEGHKKASVDIIYTPWANLRKDQNTMDTGTIGFKDTKQVVKIRNVDRNRELLNRLEKSRTSVKFDLESARLKRDREELAKTKTERKEAVRAQQDAERQEREEYQLKHYEALRKNAEVNNQTQGDGTIQNCRVLEDDFM